MEPSSVEDGNETVSRMVSFFSRHASMEPSSVEDGNARSSSPLPPANRELQWSRPQLRTETPLHR